MSALTLSFPRIVVAILLLGGTSVALAIEILREPGHPGRRYRLGGALAFMGAAATLLLPAAYTWMLAQVIAS